jgi:RHS repeat-associated protein
VVHGDEHFFFGEMWVENYADAPISPINLRFPGQYFDAETGLNYNYYRSYWPLAGRYVQHDPIGLAGGLNPYLYADGNPLTNIDPLGLDTMNTRITVLVAQGRTAELTTLLEGGALKPAQEVVVRGALLRMQQGVTGAKSAVELATHVSKLEVARERAMNLRTALEGASGKKVREAVAQQLDDLLRQIRGHEKEIWQKWPDVAKFVCP